MNVEIPRTAKTAAIKTMLGALFSHYSFSTALAAKE